LFRRLKYLYLAIIKREAHFFDLIVVIVNGVYDYEGASERIRNKLCYLDRLPFWVRFFVFLEYGPFDFLIGHRHIPAGKQKIGRNVNTTTGLARSEFYSLQIEATAFEFRDSVCSIAPSLSPPPARWIIL